MTTEDDYSTVKRKAAVAAIDSTDENSNGNVSDRQFFVLKRYLCKPY